MVTVSVDQEAICACAAEVAMEGISERLRGTPSEAAQILLYFSHRTSNTINNLLNRMNLKLTRLSASTLAKSLSRLQKNVDWPIALVIEWKKVEKSG